jgi:hypothetical protein
LAMMMQSHGHRSNWDVVVQLVKSSKLLAEPQGTFCATRSLGTRQSSPPCMPRGFEPCPADARPLNDIGPPGVNIFHIGRSVGFFFVVFSVCELSFPVCCSFSFLAMASSSSEIPSSILIVGSGAFGLSTAWALCRNTRFQDTTITVVDRQPFPTPDSSSVSQ